MVCILVQLIRLFVLKLGILMFLGIDGLRLIGKLGTF